MFRIKCISIALVFALIVGLIAGYFLIIKPNYIKSYADAQKEYKEVAKKDFEDEKLTFDTLTKTKNELTAQIKDLRKTIDLLEPHYNEVQKALQDERAQYLADTKADLSTELLNKEAEFQKIVDAFGSDYSTISSDVVYDFVLTAVSKVDNAELVMFVPDEKEENYYTVKYVGFGKGLSEVLNNLADMMDAVEENISGDGRETDQKRKPVRYSIGNISLRQVYDAFSNGRSWDGTSLLEWYDNSYITGTGKVAKIAGGYKFRNVQILGREEWETDLTPEELKAAMETALEQNALIYKSKIDNMEALKLSKLADAASSGNYGSHPNFDEFKEELTYTYDIIIQSLKDEKVARDNEIKAEYGDQINILIEDIKDEQIYDPSNPDLLIYTLDITFSVDPGFVKIDLNDLLNVDGN